MSVAYNVGWGEGDIMLTPVSTTSPAIPFIVATKDHLYTFKAI